MHLTNDKDFKVRAFDGDEKHFHNFLDDSKAYFEVIRPELAEIVEWLEMQPKALDMPVVRSRYSDVEGLGRLLHGWLCHKLRGTACAWCRDKQPTDGVCTWREMLEKYDPTTGASILDLQARKCRIDRVKTLKELPEAIGRWEKRNK